MAIKPGPATFDEGLTREQIIALLQGDGDSTSSSKKKSQEDVFGTPQFFWQDAAVDKILADIKYVANTFDLDLDHLNGWFSGQQNNMLSWIQKQMAKMNEPFGPRPVGLPDGRSVVDEPGGFRINLTETPEGIARIFDLARQWVSMYWPGFRDAVLMELPSSGGGRGSRGPTAAEIRAQFDLDQLTRVINEMSRGLVLAEEPNARAMAIAYVDAIVKDPNQELDFETWVRSRLLNTARAKTIYKGKPESMSEEQYLQPYVSAFTSMVGPGYGDQMADTATAGARLNASPDAFGARLQRTSQVQTSTPFLSKIGQRFTNFSEILR